MLIVLPPAPFASGHYINAAGTALGVVLLVIDYMRLRAGRKLAVP